MGRRCVLDVKLRSSQVRAARMRMAAVALAVVFASVLAVLFVWRGSAWLLDRLIYQNRAFAIESIDIQTDGVLSQEQLRRWAGVRPGQNLLALDLARVKRDLELVSVIERASVERILPHTLRLRITEREPIAQFTVTRPAANNRFQNNTFYLDPQGYVLLPLEPRQRAVPPPELPEPLPVVTGLNANEVQVGHALDSPQVQAALQLLDLFERSPMGTIAELKSVEVGYPEVLVATTTQGTVLTFGLTNLEQQLRRWHAVMTRAQSKGLALASLDLAVTNNVPARLLDASAVPPMPIKRSKPPRKHHV